MKKIYINPGHSDRDPGAVGYETERRLNVAVSNHMNQYLLDNYECETRMNPGSMDGLTAICNDANKWGADLFVSNHFNAGGGDGYEALVYSQKSVPLGRVFEDHVLAIGQNSRGVKIRKDLTVLKKTKMPAVLNEGAFVDNKKDIQDWNDDAELKKLGIAYAKAAAEFLGLKEKPVVNVTYSLEQFIRDVQKACGASVDGIAGKETLSKTVTISAQKNRTHAVVKAVQKRLSVLGYAMVGEADGIAGTKFTAAVTEFQADNKCWIDGEVTAKNKTWKKLLGIT
jgi:N-acetylmuramoyl-L-alanine amidase